MTSPTIREAYLIPGNTEWYGYTPIYEGGPKKEVGDLIKWINVDQMKALSEKMGSILFQRGAAKDPQAKLEFLTRMPFIKDFRESFQYGSLSRLALGTFYTYSRKDLEQGGYPLRYLLGEELAREEHYCICLGLDLKQTEIESRLVFLIIEKNGEEELSRISFTLEELGHF